MFQKLFTKRALQENVKNYPKMSANITGVFWTIPIKHLSTVCSIN